MAASSVEENVNYTYYFPYPDPVVHFVYKISGGKNESKKSLVNAWDDFIPHLEPAAQYLEHTFPMAVNELKKDTNNRKYMLLFPIRERTEQKEHKQKEYSINNLYDTIGTLQYLLQTFPGLKQEIKKDKNSYLSKIHLGSPHLFYRWLWSRMPNQDIHYQIIGPDSESKIFGPESHPSTETKEEKKELKESEPIYPRFTPNISEENIAQLDPNTLLVLSGEKLSRKQDEDLSKFITGVYCGDLQQGWEYSLGMGNSGSFAKCLDLFNKQQAQCTSCYNGFGRCARSYCGGNLPYYMPPSALPYYTTSGTLPYYNTPGNVPLYYNLPSTPITSPSVPITSPNQQLSDINLETAALEEEKKVMKEKIERAKERYMNTKRDLLNIYSKPVVRSIGVSGGYTGLTRPK